MNILDAYNYIKSSRAQEKTDILRSIEDKKEQQEYKSKNFDYVLFSGTFSCRKDDGLIKHSCFICIDFDDLGFCCDSMKQRLLNDNYFETHLLFKSPRGKGLKWVVYIDLDRGDHYKWFTAIQNYIKEKYCIDIDASCKNVSRACYLSWDPNCYVNENPKYQMKDASFDLEKYSQMGQTSSQKNATTIHTKHTTQQNKIPTIHEFEELKEAVEILTSNGIDLVSGYERWRNVGFAIADIAGEQGRPLFHELSRIGSDYDPVECDKQYSYCLNEGGITGATFWKLAEEAGVNIKALARKRHIKEQNCAECANAQQSTDEEATLNNNVSNIYNNMTKKDLDNNSQATMISDAYDCANAQIAQKGEMKLKFDNTFSDQIPRQDLPSMIQSVYDSQNDVQGKDMMLLATINVMSGILPNFYAMYSEHVIYPQFYTIVYGEAANKKGDFIFCQQIMNPIKKQVQDEYKKEMEDFRNLHSQWEAKGNRASERAERGPEPQEPSYRSPVIPANISISALYQQLDANGGSGTIFETEVDVLNQAFRSEWGDYSTVLRKAFHHEPISLNRVKDHVHLEVEEPKLAVCMTCTPGQLTRLFPSLEDGLASRFLFYGLNDCTDIWKDPFAKRDKQVVSIFQELGNEAQILYNQLQKLGKRSIQFVLSDSQQKLFNDFFSQLLHEQHDIIGDNIASFIKRMGVVTVRIAMVLSMLRHYSDWDKTEPLFKEGEQALICKDVDCKTALTIINTLVNHTGIIFTDLNKSNSGLQNLSTNKMTPAEQSIFNQLEQRFTTEDFRKVSDNLNMNIQTTRRYLNNYLNKYKVVKRVKNGLYCKI